MKLINTKKPPIRHVTNELIFIFTHSVLAKEARGAPYPIIENIYPPFPIPNMRTPVAENRLIWPPTHKKDNATQII